MSQLSSLAVPVDQSFSYDSLGRIISSTGETYSYDASGNLLQITAAAAPVIAVEQPAGTGLTDGVSSVGFGTINPGSSSSAVIFTIRNTGTADLTGISVTKDGAHSGDFGLSTTGMLTTLVAGNSTTFTIVFSPSASGARTAALHIASNDATRSPFNIALTGTGATTMFTISTSASPVAGGTASGGGSFASGSQATLTATANGSYAFVNWTEAGSPVSSLSTYVFTVTANRSLVANFTPGLDTVAALDAPSQTYGNAGTTAWYGQGVVTHDGTDAARSGMIGHSESSSLTTTITGPATVSFYWKVSSETSWDFLRVYVDDVDQGGGISGEVDWAQRTLSIPAGTHTVRWTYSKDSSASVGSDAGFVDQLVVQSTASGNYAYVRSAVGAPWASSAVPGQPGSNEAAMDAAFGAGNWADLRFESVTPSSLFSSTYQVIYLDGSEMGATELEAFLTANMTAMQNWVAAGGRLFLNAAPNEDNGMSFGFGVTLTYASPSSVAGNASAAMPGHAIFNSPASAPGPFSGNSFSHGTVSGAGLTTLISGTGSDAGKVALAEMAYGSGKVLFGGMTPSYFHSPQPSANNLRANILSYLAQTSSSNADLSNLALSAGTLSPAFSSATTSYTASVSNATTSVTVTPTKADAGASITVNGATVASGSPSGPLSLNVGANTITTIVTAQNGTTTKTYSLSVTRAASSGPLIVVEQPTGTALVDGSSSISLGSTHVGGGSTSASFTIRNSGTSDLTGLAVTKDGSHSGDFLVSTSGTLTTVTPGGTTSFSVLFLPTGQGTRTAALHITSNDTARSPFDISLTGTGLDAPDIQLDPPAGTPYSDYINGLNFQTVTVGSASASKTFTITNSGTSSLSAISVSIGGTNASDFAAGTGGMTTTVLPAGSTTFTVSFVPTATGSRSAYVAVYSNDPDGDENPTYFYLRGSGASPVPRKAQITSPANGSTLASTSLPLVWNAGVGVTSCYLFVGTTAGGSDLYAGNQGTNLSKTVTVPADRRIHVTLWSLMSGSYQANYYVYEPVPSVKAALTSPADGSTLTSGSVTLNWTPGTGVSTYALWLGSSPGGYDLGAAASGSATTWTFSSVPQDGGPIYLTLWSLINGAWQSNTYWFTTALPVSGNRPARLTSPANASTLSSASLDLVWDAGVGATSYALWVGSKADGYDLFAGMLGTATSKTVAIPGDGRRIFVTLHSLIGGAYQSNAYYFTAPTLPDKGAAQITAPASGTTLGSTSLPLTWTSAAGATQYALWLGDAPMGYNRYAGAEGLNLNKTLTTPADGSPVYATLYSLINGGYLPSTAWFTTANTGTGNKRARLTSPANGTTLTNSQTFTWDSGTGVTNCALWIGSSPGSYDLLAAAVSPNSNRTVTLPTDGRKIYATLHSLIGGAYQSNGWFFTAASVAPSKATITSPADGSVLPGASATFTWSPSNVATAYALWIGRKPGGYDVYAGAEGLNTSKTLTTLPTDGGPVYATLYSLINGAWQSTQSIYQAARAP